MKFFTKRTVVSCSQNNLLTPCSAPFEKKAFAPKGNAQSQTSVIRSLSCPPLAHTKPGGNPIMQSPTHGQPFFVLAYIKNANRLAAGEAASYEAVSP